MTENGNGKGRRGFFDPVLVFLKLAFGWRRLDRVSGQEQVVNTDKVLDDLDDRLPEPDRPNETEN
ncbi:MAG: hypothetical protein KME64_08025 [Scytonematopsis contorta HA4267-MV1]|jgi:hypothetical protein|nr:hypothetical protein [Scytonematopsis contorta HA4267-MV1]